MAGAGFKDFEAGEKLFAADVDNYLMQQSVMRFASAAARGSAIGTAIAEGMMSYLDDSNSVEVYNGSAWVGLESTLNDGTQGYTALSNGTAGISYQPVSPNYIINSGFDVWQRGTSFSPNSGSPTFYADRWSINNTTDTLPTITREAFTPAEVNATGYGEGQFYTRIAFANNQTASRNFSTSIEDVRTLAGQTATYSFWAKASSSISIQTTIWQEFGSGGSSLVSTGNVTYTIGTSWQRYTFTVEMPSISGKTIGVGSKLTVIPFRYSTGTDLLGGVTIDIWGVQLEAGSVATPFKRNAPGLQGELAACQRYYLALGGTTNYPNSFGYVATTTEVRAIIPTPVQMRATPTLTDATPRMRVGTSNLIPSSTTVLAAFAGNGIQVSYAQTGMTANNVAVITHDGTANLSAEL